MRASGQGTKRSDGRWQTVVCYSEDGYLRRKTIIAKTQGEMKAKAHAFRLQVQRQQITPSMSVADFLNWWQERLDVKPKTAASYRQNIRTHIVPIIGGIQITALAPRHVERMLDECAAKGNTRAPTLVRAILRKALADAMREGLLERNVAAIASPPKTQKLPERPPLTDDDLGRILDAEPNPVHRALWRTLGEVGLRPAETIALTWANLKSLKDGYWLGPDESKTEAGEQPRPISHELAAQLLELKASSSSVFIFPSEKGTMLSYRNVVRAWHAALKRADVNDTNLYQLRHLVGTRLFDLGVKEHIAAALMGHRNPRTTRQYYVRAMDEKMREAVSDVAASMSTPK